MRSFRCSALVALAFTSFSCATSEPPPAAAPAPLAPQPPEPAHATAPSPALAPSPEESKKAEEQRKLQADFAELERHHQAELARFTPELRKQGQELAQKSYPSMRAALTAALKSPHREPDSAARDAQRHPLETLEFLGIRPNQHVLEYGPGEGWYTELLSPALAKNGKLYVTTADPNGAKTERSTLYGVRTKYFLDKAPEVYGGVERVVIDPKNPKLGLDGKLDAVLVFRGLHGMHNNKLLGAWLAEFHRALKPNGILGIEQHRAAAGQNVDEASKRGYLPEAYVVEQIQAAGFKLAGKSEINANPKDTKDHPEGVWSLPPTLREGDKNRDKYLAIGESDRMTLKFVKVAPPKAAPTSKSDSAP
jgi:predicted methyltransferase